MVIEKSEIVVFKPKHGNTEFQLVMDGNAETIWVTEQQIMELFDKARRTIGEHIRNIYAEGELEKDSTWREFRHVQEEGSRKVERKVSLYNLDVVISVGYRVKSNVGIEFRKWATQKLREYLIRGYVINQNRIEQLGQEVEVLKSGIRILNRVIEEKSECLKLDWLTEFSSGLTLLDDYDNENLDKTGLTNAKAVYPELRSYYELIESMKTEFNSQVFGIEKDKGFESAINQIGKGMDGQDFYTSIEEKSVVLLYLITKNHAFTDGNKRIAAACFLLFLKTNKIV
ncbi:MAG: virulence protein RhuM/Fic/DOC family protein [Bacteroidetes bacterium]|nr:virulence protein RhuM/Fic/DOC family protein [Bacteroidota bacterium]